MRRTSGFERKLSSEAGRGCGASIAAKTSGWEDCGVTNVDFRKMSLVESGWDNDEEEDGGKAEEGAWSEMLTETLVEVMKRLPMRDRLESVPQVCKAWRTASLEPECWQVVDLKAWCISVGVGEVIDRMVKVAVERSCGGIKELHVTYLESDACLRYLAQSGLSSLTTLCIPDSAITDDGLCELILTLPALSHLDISKCSGITKKSLEFIGQTCKSLTRLVRNREILNMASTAANDDSEAFAIAQNMPRLKYLEMVAGLLSNAGLMAIVDNCPDLEYLDVRNCWNVRFVDSDAVSKSNKMLHFRVSSTEGSDYFDEYDDYDYINEYDDLMYPEYYLDLWDL